ncbi:MAG: glycosyltransferase family 61 protein [Alphaproteobacteria bacterium]|nr:glycosyltransferase family 61 protein [Alphaproteobacteria bacterium]
MPSTFQLIPARRWFSPVGDFRDLTHGVANKREGMFVARPAFVETIDPPDFFVEPADVAGIGDGRGLGYSLDDFRLSVADAFLASMNDAQVEKLSLVPFGNNTYHLFVAPSLALAETQHEAFCHLHMMRHIGEETVVQSPAGPVPVLMRDRRPPEQRIEGDALLLAARFTHFNYFHWIVDLLSRLWCMGMFERPDEITLVMPDHRLSPFQTEILRQVGLRNPMIGLNRHVAEIERLHFPSFFAPGGYSRAQCAWLGSLLKRAFGVADGLPGRRRLYISRADAKWRGLTNEDEVTRLLAARGFQVVVPGRLPVAEQARLFASAEIVVAPHGAGNTNMLFAPRGACLIEVVAAECPNNCYYMLTKQNGQRYGRVLDRQADGARGGGMTADLERLAVVVDQAIQGC